MLFDYLQALPASLAAPPLVTSELRISVSARLVGRAQWVVERRVTKVDNFSAHLFFVP